MSLYPQLDFFYPKSFQISYTEFVPTMHSPPGLAETSIDAQIMYVCMGNLNLHYCYPNIQPDLKK